MAFAPTSPITGAAQTGLTSPTYTITADTAPDNNGKQYAVTALGGTQTGVVAHSVASPFTHTFKRPKVLKTLGMPNPNTGMIRDVPRNNYELLTRKGVIPAAGQPAQVMIIRTIIEVPAGADSYDAVSVRAAQSSHNGLIAQVTSGIGDTTVTAIL